MRYFIIFAFLAGCAAPDKCSHYYIGMGVSAIVTEVTGDPLAGCLASIGVGLAKEAIDCATHEPEALDALATAAGGCRVSIPF